MIQVIYGVKGSGKSKRILDIANEIASHSSGSMVFIDDDTGFIHDIDRRIRFIDATEYDITGPKEFMGFISGIAAQDFDLEYIFVDSFLSLVKHPLLGLEDMFKKLAYFSNRRNITLIISISGEESDAPNCIKQYII